jgi:hypothetical protein
MNRKKTLLPHFVQLPKNLEDNFIQFHLVDCMVLYGQMPPMVYFTSLNIRNDTNLTITIIQHVMTHWSSNLPQVLYVQLDTTSCKNKNQILVGYLSMLVELVFFQKVKVGFLLIRHTHDHIDQMFSYFVVTLKRNNVGHIPSLIQTIKICYLPKPTIHILQETIGIQRFIQGSHGAEKMIEQLNDILFQHQLRIKKNDVKMLILGNKFSNSAEWGPSSSLPFLKFILDWKVYASKLLLLQ